MVLAARSMSDSLRMAGSRSLMAATIGCMPLISRSCLGAEDLRENGIDNHEWFFSLRGEVRSTYFTLLKMTKAAKRP